MPDSSSSDDEEAEFEMEEEEAVENGGKDESSSEDEPLATLKTSPTRKRASASASKKVSYKEEDDEEDSDDEDDVPLSDLAAAKKQKAKKQKTTNDKKKKKTAPAKKASQPKKKKAAPVASSSNGKNYEWASAALYGTQCDKGLLIQRLLCRWWYAFQWPDRKTLPNQPPANYDALAGFPGVYICTAGEDVGKILDKRDANAAPTFRNFCKKSSQELKDLLVKALEEQKKQLVEAGDGDTATEKQLNDLIRWTNKVDASKADKEASKVLTAQGLTLP